MTDWRDEARKLGWDIACVYYDVTRNQINIMAPVPDDAVILALFEEKLNPRKNVLTSINKL